MDGKQLHCEALTYSKYPKIPTLSNVPHAIDVSASVVRNYPVGRQKVSRLKKATPHLFSITFLQKAPEQIKIRLLSNFFNEAVQLIAEAYFVAISNTVYTCKLIPLHCGHFNFKVEFSFDAGKTWQRDDVPDAWVLVDPPQADALLLYTLIPNISGTLSEWTSELPRIKEMGFNAAHLLPITALDVSESPYSAKDLFEIDHAFLKSDSSALQQLENFVNSAKELGIALCFDLVLNHVGVNSNMAVQSPDWIVRDKSQADGMQRAKFWFDNMWLYWDDLVLINYEHPSETVRADIWSYMISYALFWAKLANDTNGFVRFDNLHSSNPQFVNALTEVLHKEYPDLGIIAEYFTDEKTMMQTGSAWGLNLNLATPWNFKFVPQLRDYLKYVHSVYDNIRFFMPVTSHDSGTPCQEFGNVESTIPRYVAAVLMGTGASGLVQGVEFAEKEKIEFIGRRSRKEFPAHAVFKEFIQKVNNVFLKFDVFRTGNNCFFLDNNHASIIAAYRSDANGNGFLVACNFDIFNVQHLMLDLSPYLNIQNEVTALELLSGDMFSIPNAHFNILLDPCSAKVIKFYS